MEYSSRIHMQRGLCWDGAKASSLAQQGSAWQTCQERIEQSEGVVKGNFATVLKIRKALENAWDFVSATMTRRRYWRAVANEKALKVGVGLQVASQYCLPQARKNTDTASSDKSEYPING